LKEACRKSRNEGGKNPRQGKKKKKGTKGGKGTRGGDTTHRKSGERGPVLKTGEGENRREGDWWIKLF